MLSLDLHVEQEKLLGYFHVAKVEEGTEHSTGRRTKGSSRRGSESSLESSSSESSMGSLPHIPVNSVKREITEELEDKEGERVTVELIESTNKSPSGTNLKVFHDALFSGNSM